MVEAVFLLTIARMPDLGSGFPPFARAFLFASIPWLAAAYVTTRYPARAGRLDVALVFGVAILLRLFFLFGEPTLSDDVYRYVWEGRVQSAGHNPYVLAPAAPELAPLRDALHARINHPEIPSCYPPFLQLQFRAASTIAPSVLAMKVLFTSWDLAAAMLLVILLRRRGRPAVQAAIYAWSPLVIVEVAGNAHVEPAWIALFLAAVLLEGRRMASGVALALSAATKLVSIAFVPALARRIRGAGLAACCVTCALAFVPFASAGTALFVGMREYADRWRANDSLFRFVLAVADAFRERLLRVQWIAPRIWENPHLLSSLSIAKGLCALVLAGIGFWMWRRRTEPIRFALVLYFAAISLSPIVHPWYVVPLVAFLAVEPNLAGLLLATLVVLGYHPLPAWKESQVWREDPYYLLVEWLPVYAVLAITAVTRWRSRTRPISADPSFGDAAGSPSFP
ncbi:MAG: DUF2029 domain-containing protein [Planctomycetes bacterium]|nr:DUF2029 domain-containing protein [Planctomycetota bacterium]MBI3846214.1 DUF2029 domain-containing protein [Planctomycetota bacterium]